MGITTAQIRGARGILNWSQNDLAERTGISATSIGSIEKGQSQPRESTIASIQKAFEDGGIEFIGREGVRVKSGEITTYTGQAGFWDFYDDLYNTLAKTPSEVLVNNVDERLFVKWLGDKREEHVKRMKEIKGVTYKILIKEGDTFFPADEYAEYRWISKQFFSSVPFYLYPDKLAMMLLEETPTIIVLDYPAIAAAYRTQFEAIWAQARKPDTDGMTE